jgi:DNA-binding CsgD family transcriptional regulator
MYSTIKADNQSQAHEAACRWKNEFNEVLQIASNQGFPYLIYAPIRGHAHASQNWTATTYPEEWQDRYIKKNHLPKNPVRHHALRSRKPFLWSELERSLPAHERDIFHDCRASGMVNGIVIPIHGPEGQTISVGFACDDADAIRVDVIPMLHWLGFRLYHAEDGFDVTPCTRLTAREKELMQLLIDGMDNERIADHMHISINSVEWHLKNIFRKLNVANRTSAAIKAYKLALIYE